MSRRESILFLWASIACWWAACFLPALHLEGRANTLGEKTTMSGGAAFFWAFFGMFAGQYAWLANPLGIVSLSLSRFGRYRLALFVSVLGVLVAQQTWMLVGTEIDGDEGGVKKYLVTSLGLGFYLWVLSFVIIAAMAARG
jgi:hypothetical protein